MELHAHEVFVCRSCRELLAVRAAGGRAGARGHCVAVHEVEPVAGLDAPEEESRMRRILGIDPVPGRPSALRARTSASMRPSRSTPPVSSLWRPRICSPRQMPSTGCVASRMRSARPRSSMAAIAARAVPTPGRKMRSAARISAASRVMMGSTPSLFTAKASEERLATPVSRMTARIRAPPWRTAGRSPQFSQRRAACARTP